MDHKFQPGDIVVLQPDVPEDTLFRFASSDMAKDYRRGFRGPLVVQRMFMHKAVNGVQAVCYSFESPTSWNLFIAESALTLRDSVDSAEVDIGAVASTFDALMS